MYDEYFIAKDTCPYLQDGGLDPSVVEKIPQGLAIVVGDADVLS
jgi:hypothetical protein